MALVTLVPMSPTMPMICTTGLLGDWHRFQAGAIEMSAAREQEPGQIDVERVGKTTGKRVGGVVRPNKSPPEQQPHIHTPAASFCAVLTALLPLSVPGHLSSHHRCIDGVEKAHRELWFAWRRSQTPEIRCSRNALSVLRHYAVQFEYVEETVAVNDQRALCRLRDCPDSSTTTLADSD